MKVLWCGEHLGAYLFKERSNEGLEVSFFRTVWSPKGVGFTAFVRFSEGTAIQSLTGLYTDNRQVTEYLCTAVLKHGKPPDNIANVVREPILLARSEQENNLPDGRVERVIIDKHVIEIRWCGVHEIVTAASCDDDDVKDTPVCYFCGVGKPDEVEIRVDDKLIGQQRFTAAKVGSKETQAFIGLSEVWTAKGDPRPKE